MKMESESTDSKEDSAIMEVLGELDKEEERRRSRGEQTDFDDTGKPGEFKYMDLEAVKQFISKNKLYLTLSKQEKKRLLRNVGKLCAKDRRQYPVVVEREGFEFCIDTNGQRFVQPQRNIPMAYRNMVREAIDLLLKAGLICKVNSMDAICIFNITLPMKKDGTRRFAID